MNAQPQAPPSQVATVNKDEVFKEAFQRLRPVCVAMTKQANCSQAKALLHILENQNCCTLQHLQQYILFPLRVILHNPKTKKEDLIEVTLKCLLELFKKTSINNWQLFFDYFQLLCVLLSTSIQPDSDGIPEEIQLNVVKCLQNLIQNADSSTLISLYSVEYLASVGHAVSVLINVAEHQKLHTLRLQALSCLSCLCQDDADIKPDLTRQIGDLFASFLPGASSSLVKIIINEPKVAKYALHTWGCILVKVLDDSGVSEALISATKCSDEPVQKFMIIRDSSWLETTAPKLSILLKKASVAAQYDNWRVRLEVAEFVNRLLHNCKRSLTESISTLIEVLVGLTADSYPQVADSSAVILSSIQKAFHENNCRDITEILEENLFALTTSLPRIIMVADDAEKLARLKLLMSYIDLLGVKLSPMLRSSSHLKRLSLCLMTVLEFETDDIKITQQKNLYHDGPINLSSDEMQWNTDRRFKRFNDNKIEEMLKKMCKYLAKYGELDVLVEYFVDLFLESSIYQRQAVWVLNELIAGCPFPHPISRTCMTRLINEYLSSSAWGTQSNQVSPVTDTVSTTPLTTKNSMVLLSCLLLEGLAVAAKVMKNEFELFLISTLYPVLVKVSDSNMLISQSAYKTVRAFSEACNYSGIEELIYRNVDYLLDCLTLELRHSHFNTNALLVLQAMCQHGGSNLLPLIQQTINQVLSLIGQNQQGELRYLLCVCQALVTAIRKWFCIFTDEDTNEQVSESVCDFIVKHHRLQQENIQNSRPEALLKGIEEGTPDMQEKADIKDDDVMEDTSEKEVMHVSNIVQILENCVHLLGIDSSRQQTLILDIVIEGIFCISRYQDKLLPLAHLLWPVIVQRLNHGNFNVRIKAVKCVTSLANCCRDFLKKRVLKDVLPNLTQYIKQQTKYSLKKDSLYHHKLEYKLQLSIIKNIGQICVKSGIDGLDVLRLAIVCLPYLDSNQPITLRTSTETLMEQLKTVEYDAIELMLEDFNRHNSEVGIS
ncbi:TELO2-interacting protein 1 homolog [Antedon mediterranea]|uniref:TELO2-interacting protein 1 homolog n=1 Tax=Antedon mediterranea TaxID=105859 RepID=UPI003AF77186